MPEGRNEFPPKLSSFGYNLISLTPHKCGTWMLPLVGVKPTCPVSLSHSLSWRINSITHSGCSVSKWPEVQRPFWIENFYFLEKPQQVSPPHIQQNIGFWDYYVAYNHCKNFNRNKRTTRWECGRMQRCTQTAVDMHSRLWLQLGGVVVAWPLSHVWLSHDPVDCSLPGPSVHGILQGRILEWVAISFLGDLLNPRIELELAGGFFTTEPPRKPPTISRKW